MEKRIQYAYPAAARQEQTALRKGEKNFLSVSDLLWLFVIGAFLGDMVETVFCRVTAGVWMSRSSLVWGPFSVVWGLALVLATVLLRQEKDRSDRYLFAFGTVMGGVYEYVCSAVTELLFGTVFWDYSKFKFNLGGRINLLYCFFLGHCGGDMDALRLSAGAQRHGEGAQPRPPMDDRPCWQCSWRRTCSPVRWRWPGTMPAPAVKRPKAASICCWMRILTMPAWSVFIPTRRK